MPEVTPRVSVVIPNYNHAHYVGDAIRSVLDQAYPNVDVIVVDDGSIDDSRQVVGEFGDRVRYVWQENRGLSAARNTGIGLATGEAVCVLDADDIYEPEFVGVLAATLERNPDAGAAYCGYQFVDHLNRPLPQREARSIPAGRFHRVLADGNFLVPEAMMVRRSSYRAVGPFDERLTACEDWDMWLRLSARFEVVGTDRILARHRIVAGSMSTDPVRMLRNRLAVVAKHFGPVPEGTKGWSRKARRAYGRAYLTSCVEHMQVGDDEGEARCARAMVASCPDLLLELDTLYQLACGRQPKGWMGDFGTLNLEEASMSVGRLLNGLFGEPATESLLRSLRRRARANADVALGLLSYGAGDYHRARRFLSRAVLSGSRVGLRREAVSTLLKSMPGVAALKHWRGRRLT